MSSALPAAPEPVAAVRRRSRQPTCHARALCPRIASAKLCPCAHLERVALLLPSGFGSEEGSPLSFPGAGSLGTLSGTTVRTSSLSPLGTPTVPRCSTTRGHSRVLPVSSMPRPQALCPPDLPPQPGMAISLGAGCPQCPQHSPPCPAAHIPPGRNHGEAGSSGSASPTPAPCARGKREQRVPQAAVPAATPLQFLPTGCPRVPPSAGKPVGKDHGWKGRRCRTDPHTHTLPPGRSPPARRWLPVPGAAVGGGARPVPPPGSAPGPPRTAREEPPPPPRAPAPARPGAAAAAAPWPRRARRSGSCSMSRPW